MGDEALGSYADFWWFLTLKSVLDPRNECTLHYTHTLHCRWNHRKHSNKQTNNSEALRFKRAAFYNGLKSKVGLAAAKASVCLLLQDLLQSCAREV